MSVEGIKEYIVIRDDSDTTAVIVSDTGQQGPPGAGSEVDWSEIVSKPTEFPAATHVHDWDSVTFKPTEFTPVAHSHDADQITGNFAYVDVDTALIAPAHQAGRLFYDQTNQAMSYYCDIVGSSLQIGQEQWVRVRNNTGSALVQGDVVKLVGAQGQTPTVSKAMADADSNYDALGVVTSDSITNNAVGLVTVFGVVHGMNTSMWNDGDPLFLSSTVLGGLTNVLPAAPANPVSIGNCIYSHGVNGKVFVRVLAAGVNDDQIKVDAGTFVGIFDETDTNMHTILEKTDKHTHTLQGLSNVADTAPANGQTLVYNSTNSTWEPKTASALTLGMVIALMG